MEKKRYWEKLAATEFHAVTSAKIHIVSNEETPHRSGVSAYWNNFLAL